MISIPRKTLIEDLEKEFFLKQYKDFGHNGLQIEGKENIRSCAFAVSACRETILKACALKVDMMIVHHGLFWNFHGSRVITGHFAKRIIPLIQNEINLIGIHLPLDGHPEKGHAALIAKELSMSSRKTFAMHEGMPTGTMGTLPESLQPHILRDNLQKILGHQIIMACNNLNKKILTMGIITGAARGGWVHCVREKLDAYLTGEISEHDWHESQEAGIVMYAGGHGATEQFGIKQLMKDFEIRYSLPCHYIDSENPV